MGGQFYFHAIVDIEPLGMMVEGLRDECGARHESESLTEILESEFTLEFAFADGGAGSAALSYEVSAGAETIGTAFKGNNPVESFAFCIDNCDRSS